MTSYKAGVACLLVCAAGIGAYQLNEARVATRLEVATLANASRRQAREIAALREENDLLRAAIAGKGGTPKLAAARRPIDSDGIRQQVLSAFRTASFADAFMQLATVFQHLSPANWRGALQGFEDARKQGDDAGRAWYLFAQRVGESVGKEGVEYFVATKDLDAARWALSGWASTNPTAAVAWIGNEASPETRRLIVGAAIRGLALAEPDLAVTALETIPIEQRKNYVFDFAANLVRGAGMAQSDAIVNGIIQRAAANGVAADDYVRRIFGEYTEIKARRAAVSGDFSTLADWVKAHANQPYADALQPGDRTSLVWGTAAVLAQTSVPKALAWLDTLHAAGPVGADSPVGYGIVLTTWADNEGAAAVARWLDANTAHPRYDNMVAQYAPMLAKADADQAKKLAGTIKNPALRDDALQKIAQISVAKQPGS